MEESILPQKILHLFILYLKSKFFRDPLMKDIQTINSKSLLDSFQNYASAFDQARIDFTNGQKFSYIYKNSITNEKHA